MEQRLTPEVFYGSAIAALVGLVFGVALHAPWEKHPGGPQILFSRAEAAERVQPPVEDAATEQAVSAEPVQAADLDTSYVPPSPLPVTRLHPEMFDVQPAAVEDAQREDVDDPVADAPPQALSQDVD